MFKPIAFFKVSSVINLALFLSCSSFALAEQVWAKSKSNNNSNEGLPVRRVGGGTRRECSSVQSTSPEPSLFNCSSLMALMPETIVDTSTQFPTLLLYIPAMDNSEKIQIEFVLQNEEKQVIYETTFTSNGKSGIISFKIPSTENFKGLKTGQNYHWYFSIIYNPIDRAHDDVVEGMLSYIPPNSTFISQLNQATPLEKVQIYQQNNFWHEAFITLAQLKQSHPEDPVISQKWTELLHSVELKDIASEPLSNEILQPYPVSDLTLRI